MGESAGPKIAKDLNPTPTISDRWVSSFQKGNLNNESNIPKPGKNPPNPCLGSKQGTFGFQGTTTNWTWVHHPSYNSLLVLGTAQCPPGLKVLMENRSPNNYWHEISSAIQMKLPFRLDRILWSKQRWFWKRRKVILAHLSICVLMCIPTSHAILNLLLLWTIFLLFWWSFLLLPLRSIAFYMYYVLNKNV